jgi:hypothetical protein
MNTDGILGVSLQADPLPPAILALPFSSAWWQGINLLVYDDV